MSGALSGLKILDFSALLPGPYATMCLADMGADVLKIASASRPDGMSQPPFLSGNKISAAMAHVGRNKNVMTLNLKDPRSIKIIHQLLEEYDIVVEQFRPGVMSKLRLDYESLKSVNPRLIYCSLTGYGQNGSMRNRAGHDINYIALSGIASYSGKKETGPALMGMQAADLASGANNTIIGILAAVIYRQNFGKGQYIDISMTDGMIAFNAMMGAAYLLDGSDPSVEGHYTNGGALYDYYQTKDRRYVAFGGVEAQFFTAFCQGIGRPDLIAGGIQPQDCEKVKNEVRNILRTKTLEEWKNIFSTLDACFEPVLKLSEALSSQLVKDRGMVVEVPAPDGKTVKQIASPIKFSESLLEYKHIGIPTSEANTKEVIQSLGYTDSEIEEFEKTGLFS
ncbi:CaiB/BaiF CoA transferase family protein [Desulfitobacterium hafniense]|uniref:Carnitine dehydratase n=1 Tax=Desulfitobacterium hafniense (strain Y51) TaxID=138119 RepID=Q24QV9_DESHY|nr:CaiB/BaiF CoA-transferase family protein [Desulfitobacterium hafniense]BAE85583.1 hypothetical protein DSY3794 [Desulfitobacterium hafniense Y51]